MNGNHKIYVIVPAINEELSIGKVLDEIPLIAKETIVVDNGSTDNTPKIAANHGAIVLKEIERGYGAACLKGLDYLFSKRINENDIIVFLDGDYSDYPQELTNVIKPIIDENYDMVIGSRILGKKLGKTAKGSLLPQAIFGNWLSTLLISLIWDYRFTDLGPFRAIKAVSLKKMNMRDRNFGWTVEMQIKAAKLKLKSIEVPVSYRKRIGESKVSGTISGSFNAGLKILSTIFISLFKKV